MPEVSILMPCYNAERTISGTLASLEAQTLADFEVISIDDGSKDATLTILEKWAKKDSRFQVISLPHGGIIPALNLGLAHCQSAYVARMDADDLAHPERLALQAAFLAAHPEVGVVSSLVAGFPKHQLRKGFRLYIEWLNSLRTHDDICREIFVESPLAHPTVMYRKSLVQSLGGYQERGWAEDYDLWMRMYYAGVRFGKVNEYLLKWREHPNRATRTDSRYNREKFMLAKAHYLWQGPLVGRDGVIIWGAGEVGGQLSRFLKDAAGEAGFPLAAFVDIAPKKIGKLRHGRPIISTEMLLDWWSRYRSPVILAAVGVRNARAQIRSILDEMGLIEAQDWWAVA